MGILKLISLLSIFCIVLACAINTEVSKNEGKEQCQVKTIQMLEGIFANLVECLRTSLQQGFPQIGITSIDPLRLPLLPLPFFNNLARGLIFLTNFKLTGLTGFELTNGNITLFPHGLKFGMKFPKLEITSNYRGKLELFDQINLHGKGKLNLTFSNFGINSSVNLNIAPFPISITELFIEMPLPETQTRFTGLFNDEYMSDLISRQLTDTLKAIFEAEQDSLNKLIYNFLWNIVTDNVNPYLEEFTFEDIVRIIIDIVGGERDDGVESCKMTSAKIANKIQKGISNYYYDYISNFDLSEFDIEN